jgi:hypothetical protein
MIENSKYGMLQKLAVNQKDVNEPLRFLYKPTAINLQTLHDLNRRGKLFCNVNFMHEQFRNVLSVSLSHTEKYFKDWNKILLDKEEKERIENFAIISRDEIARRRVADEMKVAADRQAKYEAQLKKMGIPVIVGLVRMSNLS